MTTLEVIKYLIDFYKDDCTLFALTDITDVPEDLEELGDEQTSDMPEVIKGEYVNQSSHYGCEDCYYGTVSYVLEDKVLVFSFEM